MTTETATFLLRFLCGWLCHATSAGTFPLVRRVWYASVNHGSGMKRRVATNA